MNMKKLRWGIVGTGRIAEQFCQDMSFVDNGMLFAVAARDGEHAKRFADKYQIKKFYQGYQALFDDSDVDVVYIATPHNCHYQQTYSALIAGKSVLCEKPITVSSEECKNLSELAKNKGLFLMEAMWTYFLPAMIKAKKWVDEGRIGKLKHIKADFGYPIPYQPSLREYNVELAGGCLLEMGIYPIAIAQYFTENVMQDMVVKSNLAPNGVENDVVILAKSNGVVLSLSTSFQCKLQNWAYIIGDKGYIAIPDFWRAGECSLYQLDQLVDHFDDNRKSLGFNFEAQMVGEAIKKKHIEMSSISHEQSIQLQEQIEKIKHFINVVC